MVHLYVSMDTPPLNKALLSTLGFKKNELRSKERLTVMTKNNFELVIVDDGTVLYTQAGFDHPIKDLAALQKLYKEVKREDLI